MGEDFRPIPIPENSVLSCGVQRDIVSSVETTFSSLLGKFHLNEDAVCFGIFKANDDVFCATNARNLASALGVNKLTDLRQDEFAASYTGFKPVSRWSGLLRLSTHEYNGVPLASSVDWTTQGVVTRAVQFLLVPFQQQALSRVRGPSALAILCPRVSGSSWIATLPILVAMVVGWTTFSRL